MLIVLLSLVAQAQDLYDPEPPPGSAFVRVLRADGGGAAYTLSTIDLGTVEVGHVTAYVPVPAGAVPSPRSGLSVKGSIEAGGYYTVVDRGQGTAPLLVDGSSRKLHKAVVQVYNVSDAADVDLRLPDGKTAVVADVAPGATGHREVNPLKVTLVAYADDQGLPELTDRKLDQGGVYTAVVAGEGPNRTVTWTRAETRTR